MKIKRENSFLKLKKNTCIYKVRNDYEIFSNFYPEVKKLLKKVLKYLIKI